MQFTREPTIETIITPREGFKLVIRNSKAGGQEDLFVDAIEVICFGQSCFYRSLEKPKSFIVPAADYEILEVRETRLALKTAGVERGVKVPLKSGEEPQPEGVAVEPKRRERKRQRRKRLRGAEEVGAVSEEEVERAPLIPPPTTLISETIARYKEPAPPLVTFPQRESPPAESTSAEDEEAPFVEEVETPMIEEEAPSE